MTKTYYMHTLDGCPAVFDNDQVCFMNFFGKSNFLASSLKQIRCEQKASRDYRKKQNLEDDSKYGYRRVSVPTDSEEK